MDFVALEEIRQLKYRYLRSVDEKRWDELADTLTPDATADYGTPTYGKPLSLVGRDRYLRCPDGAWRIAHTGYQRTYEATLSLADLPSFRLTSNRWAGAAAAPAGG